MQHNSQGSVKNNLNNILIKLENFKAIYLQAGNIDQSINKNGTVKQLLFNKLNNSIATIINEPISDELKFYKLSEEISNIYFKLKQNYNLQLDQKVIICFFDYFKPEITNSDYYLFQVSQSMIED